MNKQEYLSTLYNLLDNIPENDKNEIMYDYEEHFRIGAENGKTEQEIAESLGDVRLIARQFRADCSIRHAETNTSARNIFGAVFAIGMLGFFNLVFVLGPFLFLVGILAGLFAGAGGFVIMGIGIVLGLIFAPILPEYISLGGLNPGFIVFSSIGFVCLGLLLLIGVFYLSKLFYNGTVKYLKWNMEFIRKGGNKSV